MNVVSVNHKAFSPPAEEKLPKKLEDTLKREGVGGGGV